MVLVKDILGSRAAIERLFSGHPRAKDGIHFARCHRKVRVVIEDYETAQRKILEEHGIRDDSRPGSYHFWKQEPVLDDEGNVAKPGVLDVDAADAYSEAIEVLVSVSADRDFTISIDEIDKAKIDPNLTPAELSALWWVIADFYPEEDGSDEEED